MMRSTKKQLWRHSGWVFWIFVGAFVVADGFPAFQASQAQPSKAMPMIVRAAPSVCQPRALRVWWVLAAPKVPGLAAAWWNSWCPGWTRWLCWNMLRYVEIEAFFCTLLWVLICKEFLSWIFSRVPCSLQCMRFTGTENTGGWQFPVVPRKKDRKVLPCYMGPGDWQWTFRVKVPCSLDMFGWKNMMKQGVHNVVFSFIQHSETW